MGFNYLQHLSNDTFSPWHILWNLYLDNYKRLTILPKGCIGNLTLLRELNIQWNELTTLSDDLFENLFKLEILYIHNNHLQDLSDQTFDALVNLTELIIDSNDLKRLPSMSPLINLKYLYKCWKEQTD